MKLRNCLAVMAVLVVVGAGVAIADDASTQPSDAGFKPTLHLKLTGPISQLSGLTDDQKSKILQIHLAVLEQERQLHEQETKDIMDVLTDDQKKELQGLMAKQMEERKAAEDERRAEVDEQKAQTLQQQAAGGATSQPSDGGK